MANLTRTNWEKGWVPSQDDVNGDPSGLLRMDNLRQNEEGVLTLARGQQQLNSVGFSDYVSRMFSKVINGVEYIWAALNIATTDIRRTSDNFASSTSIATAGGNRACFGDALGKVLICAGSIRKKDNGTTVQDLGIVTPLGPPAVVANNAPILFLSAIVGNIFSLIVGHDLTTPDNGAAWNTNGLLGIVQLTFPSIVNTLITDDAPSANPQDDFFSFAFQPADSSVITAIALAILLDSGPNPPFYYARVVVPGNPQVKQGIDIENIITIPRSAFNKVGGTNDQDWSKVFGIQAVVESVADVSCFVGAFHVNGGNNGQLFGNYEWAQVDINDDGTYIAKSPLSPATDPILIIHSTATITPNHTDDTQVTEHRIYRRSIPAPSLDLNGEEIPDLLNDWTYVGLTPKNTAFIDTLDDNSAIEGEDITLIANEFLQSLRDVNDIVGMEGMFNERMLYLTKDQILLSDRLNPDAIDIRFTIKAFGDPTERNLFLKKITNSQLLLATTKDLYEINGTLLDLPDGSIDAQVLAIGEKYPALSSDFAFSDGKLFYTASDGVRVTSGSNSVNISTQLALLFQGEDRHGIKYVQTTPNDIVGYNMCIGHGNLYIGVLLNGGQQATLIYSLTKNTWRYQDVAPLAMWVTQADRILFGLQNFIFEFEKGTTAQDIFFQTIYDDNQQPRNRKDTFTLKIVADTGGADVDVYLGKDKGSFVKIKTINHNGSKTFYIDLSSYTLGFRYAIQLQGAALSTFFLYEATIEYDPRPEQVNFLRVPNTNMGSYARKRWTSFAFVVDTLGNNVTFTPYVDNAVSGATSVVNKATKLTYIHFFTSETLGTDIGGTLETADGSPFEFYGVNLEETVSEKLPTPAKFLVIPANDYGTPNRKRFTSYKFQINTKGYDVTLVPRVDGSNFSSRVFNTFEKRTVEYFFNPGLDVKGIDIGGVLQSDDDQEFEFYGVITPQQVEQIPPRLQSLYTPHTNFGVAARKRIRTLPIIIDTGGINTTFTPIVDGISLASSILNTSRKQTVYHYFLTDVFGTDFGGIFQHDSDAFEFYEFGSPEGVEVLPVPKKYDQLGPLRFDKIGKIFGIRLRLINVDSTLAYALYDSSTAILPGYTGPALYSGTLTTTPNVDETYEILLPKSVNTNIARLVLGPTTNPFHRYDIMIKVSQSGMETDSQWVPIK